MFVQPIFMRLPETEYILYLSFRASQVYNIVMGCGGHPTTDTIT